MIALVDLQEQLKISDGDMDCLLEYLEIEPFNDMVSDDEAREITSAYLNGELDDAQEFVDREYREWAGL